MAHFHRSALRQVFSTAHKILLNKLITSKLMQLDGNSLVLGSGHEPYHILMPNVSTLLCTDIEIYPGVDQIVDAHKLPYANCSFDTVVAIEVFEHLCSPVSAANEIHRVLSEGGTALVSVPFMFHVHGDPFDYHRFTESGLFELFNKFNDIRVIAFGNRLHAISDIVTTASRPLAVLRIFNHFFSLISRPSVDCQSGYIVELRK